jgi:hypothetical protein
MTGHGTWRSSLLSGNQWQGASEHLAHCPPSGGSAGCQSFGPSEVSWRCQVATSLSWRNQLHPKRGVRTHNMRASSPPLQMDQQLWSRLRLRPGTTSQRGSCMSHGQWSPFHERRVHPSPEASSLQGGGESVLGSKPHHRGHPHQLAPPRALFHLARDQARRHLPPQDFPTSTSHISPRPKMSREGRKGEIQAVTGEDWETEKRLRCVAGSG